MISVDGLRPADIIGAKRLGLKVPALRAMMAHGAYATGVICVLPTLTYPSHTTLITGAAPARHGIGNNLTFDPTGINQIGWTWYTEDIRMPTLLSVARAKGLRTANVHWPVSVAPPVDLNLPQIWRTGHEDDRKLMRALATPALLARPEAKLGAYPQGIDESVEADEGRAHFAEELLRTEKPVLTTVYLASVDHNEHLYGPGSPEALATIARNHAIIAQLNAAARAAEPDITVVVVSDRRFQAVANDVNLCRPFVDTGLITLDAAGKVSGWRAMPWLMEGSVAIVLADPGDAGLRSQVATLLDRLKADGTLGIANVLDPPAIASLGGTAEASFPAAFRPGFEGGRDPPRRRWRRAPTRACTAISRRIRRCGRACLSTGPRSPATATSAKSTCDRSPPRLRASSA